jgi:hypothetical protein
MTVPSRGVARVTVAGLAALLGFACGEAIDTGPGVIEGSVRPDPVRGRKSTQQVRAYLGAAGKSLHSLAEPPKQILFGDLHVHTSYSWDGLLATLPLVGGEGMHPPADACDFARYCADLDFFALTDHAESLTPEQWALSKESVRQCNATAGDAGDPDLVAFTGFEWSQAGLRPETHWGHRCVVFPETGDEALPPRPIGAADTSDRYERFEGLMRSVRWLQPQDFRTYDSIADQFAVLAAVPLCPADVPPSELPDGCREVAATPGDLYARLDELSLDALAIPHGSTWGTYTPATADIARHLDPEHFDPDRQMLIEIMSGHGNSEEFRSFAALELDAAGNPVCPEPSDDFLPCCWQAGEIMRSRCGDLPEQECERRVEEARRLAARAWTLPQQVFPDADLEEWLDCDQCRDCFKPSYGYRPRESVQYAMALSRNGEGEPGAPPLRFRYGFVASSDNHTARPGTGYKQVERGAMTEVVGTPNFVVRAAGSLARRMDDPRRPQPPSAQRVGVLNADLRVQSFLYPGGMAAVHATGRSRQAIWRALKRREVYGTSGPHILLWFDLLNAPGGRAPMGREVTLAEAPRFEVRAAGDFVQQPGCPSWTGEELSPERIRRLCHDECYHPGDRRHPIVEIQVVRILPQERAGEPVEPLIEDPWRRFECPPKPGGCTVRFEDPEFTGIGRDALYYARALQEPTSAINGSPLGTVFDASGRAVSTRPCNGPGSEDGCPAPVQERAWSSPIFVNQAVR